MKDFVKGMVVKERAALDGMKRALRKLKKPVSEDSMDVMRIHEIVAEQQQPQIPEGTGGGEVIDAETEALLTNGSGSGSGSGVALETGPELNGSGDGNGAATESSSSA